MTGHCEHGGHIFWLWVNEVCLVVCLFEGYPLKGAYPLGMGVRLNGIYFAKVTRLLCDGKIISRVG